MVILHCVRTCSEQSWWCTASERVANSCDGGTALSEHVAKVMNRTLTAVMWSSVDSIQWAVCYLAARMFTALWAWLFSRRNTVDAADCCGMSCDKRGRQCCSLSCHIMSAQVCTEGSVSSLSVTLCYQYMFLWPPAVDAVTEHRQHRTNDIPLSILQFRKQPVSQSMILHCKGGSCSTNGHNVRVFYCI